MNRKRKIRRVVCLVLAVVVGGPAGFVGWRSSGGNLGTVVPGEVYRSAQLEPGRLEAMIRERGIRTVLNLRGPNPSQEWYREEVRATLGAGATQIDIPLASDQWLTRDQARTLLEVLDGCERPVLVHCQFGSERTGMVTAMEELLRPGGTLASARSQFSTYYLFLPVRDGAVMIGHLRAYESWLSRHGLSHDPARFRRWLGEEYRPSSPSRAEWPYDPYPLKVVTSPSTLTR